MEYMISYVGQTNLISGGKYKPKKRTSTKVKVNADLLTLHTQYFCPSGVGDGSMSERYTEIFLTPEQMDFLKTGTLKNFMVKYFNFKEFADNYYDLPYVI